MWAVALASLVVSKEGLHPHHEHWRAPRTVQLRVSSPSLTLTLTIMSHWGHIVKSFLLGEMGSRPIVSRL